MTEESTKSTQPSKQPLLNNQLKLFMLGMVLANVGGNMYGALLPLYLTELEASVVQVGVFFTLSRIFPLVLQILGGWVSDSLGRLRSIALGSIAGMFSYVGLLLAPTWQWVLLSEGLGAVTRSLIGPSFSAFIAEQSSADTRARVFAVTQTIFGVVSVIGPPLGGWLTDAYGFKVMILCAGAIYTAAATIRLGMARAAARSSEADPRQLSLSSLRANVGVIAGMIVSGGLFTWIMITDGITDISSSLSFDLLPLYMEEIGGLNAQQIGWLFSTFGVCNMAANIPAGWLADRKGERAAIALGQALNFGALIIFLRARVYPGYMLAWALFGLGVGMSGPAYQSLTSKVVPERLRGIAFGLLHSSLGIFSLPAPAIGAQLWQRFSPRLPFQLTAGAVLFSIVPIWLKFKTPEADADGLPSADT
ncbi:MAG TPA: MFS transporter [Chloroflexi bacterium]|nr:MFS transporter [Chloroflexota bacterium]